MQLSKSDYMLFLKHPAWLWLKKHDKTKLPPVDDRTQALFDAGNLFETYAEQLFPKSLRLGFNGYQEYLDLPSCTKAAIEAGHKVIFQGRFEHGRLTFICDVIEMVDADTVDLTEIKSSTSATTDHEYDLAFQMVVLELCGFNVRNISVIHVNNQYVRQGDIDPRAITTRTDITGEVKARRDETIANIEAALEVMNSSTIPDISPSLARHGSFKDWLDIFRGLVELPSDSVYDLVSIGADQAAELEAMGIVRLTAIPEDFKLTPKQKLQLQAVKEDRILIQPDQIREYLDTFTYPLYFFDYETFSGVIPYFDGLKPYTQFPFQYSLHIIDEPGGEARHLEYLHRTNSNPATALSEALISHIGSTGTVITWNMSFEKNCNTLIGSVAPEYQDFYAQLNERIVDLMIPFSKNWYVHKDFRGSASIKAVLPVLVPELSYKTLGIQEGAAAQRLWTEAILDGTRDNETGQILADLVEYCGLDTFAMVEIYRVLC